MVNWNVVLDEVGDSVVYDFSRGLVSGRELTEEVVFTPASGEVRKLLRKHGVQAARQLARKALARR